MATTSQEMFERVLAYCGFSSVLGPGILARALDDEGVAKQTATAAEYRRALPRIEARMAVYLPADDVARRIRRIVGYLAFVEGELDFDDEQSFSRVGHSYQELKARAETAERALAAERASSAERTSQVPHERAISGVIIRGEVPEAALPRAGEKK